MRGIISSCPTTSSRSSDQFDFDHPNAITIDLDGNYIVSWRNLDALTKINASTGALMWTLASPLSALTSDFTIVGDPSNGFSAQHCARIIDNGNLLLFDNGTSHPTAVSRAVEYKLDESAHTATMVWQFHHAPEIYTQFTGSVQRLQNGNTFIGWTWMSTGRHRSHLRRDHGVGGIVRHPVPAVPLSIHQNPFALQLREAVGTPLSSAPNLSKVS